MKFNDILRLAINSLTHRGLRSWLTILGIIIGVAAVVTMLSMGAGMTETVGDQMGNLGADILTVSPGYTRAAGSTGGFGGMRMDRMFGGDSNSEDSPTLTDYDILTISGVDGVEYVNGIISGQAEVSYLSEDVRLTVEGINPTVWSEITTAELDSGRFIGISESSCVVIGYSVANDIFEQSLSLNKQIQIEGKTFKIVGILEESGMGGFGGDDRTIFMTSNAARDILDDIDSNQYTSIEIKLDTSDSDQIESISGNIETALQKSRMVTEDTQDFTITTPSAMAETVSETMETLSLFLVGIAAISLLVGAIGIANTMFMSVLERTRLIGILKSLGTKNSEIMKLFLTESAIIGFMGGLLGIFLGLILVGFVSGSGFSILMMPRFGGSSMSNVIVTPQLILFALIFSTVIGVISGLIPARRASTLEAVVAMRSE